MGAGGWHGVGNEGGQRQKHRAWNMKRKTVTSELRNEEKLLTHGNTISAAETCKSLKFSSLLILSSSDYNLAFSVHLMAGKYSMVMLQCL